MTKIGGTTTAPHHLKSFIGGFINLVFAVSAQLCGAVATPEFLSYMDHFIRLEYGDDYGLSLSSVYGEGSTVTIHLPKNSNKIVEKSNIIKTE